jgi:cell wall-associated NlpC family hydrolase
MALDLPTVVAPPVPARIAQITARFDPSSGSATTGATSSDFASLLSDQMAAQSNSTALASLAGSDDDSSTTTDGTSATGGSSWMSALSSLLNEMGGTSTTGSTGPSGSDVVADATQYLGVPYKWGGTNPSTGLDCSGFVQRTYADLGVQLPRTAAAQATTGTPVASLASAQPGDLVAFGQPVDHIGIYVGNNKMIEAPHTGDVVKVATITAPVTAIRRIVGTTGSASSATSSITSALSSALGLGSATGSTSGSALWASALSSSSTSSTSSTATSAAAAPYQAMFNAAGAKYGIDPAVLSGVANAESSYNPNAVSSAGAVGLMQFMPSTAAGMGFDPTDPAQSIDGAARYLSAQMKTFGSLPLALAAYNAGPGAVKKYGGIPPYPETQKYVSKVMASAGQVAA